MDPLLIGQIVLAALIVFVPIVGFSYLTSIRDKQKHKARWQQFATLNGLDLVVHDGAYPSVKGLYQGYHLDLTIKEKKNEDNQTIPYTRMVITRPKDIPPAQSATDHPLTLGDLMAPFISPQTPLKGKIFATPKGRQIYGEQFGIETNLDYLENLSKLLVKMGNAYPKILTFGSQAASLLQKNTKVSLVTGANSLRPITLQLLNELTETPGALSYQASHQLCPHCLTRCIAKETSSTTPQYQCRICGQHKEFLSWAGPIVAVLDSQMKTDIIEKDGALQINWLTRRTLFDFEKVYIAKTIDKEVERFAILIGNDTDEFRRPLYKKMPCAVSSACHLSENTFRILRHTFGRVAIAT